MIRSAELVVGTAARLDHRGQLIHALVEHEGFREIIDLFAPVWRTTGPLIDRDGATLLAPVNPSKVVAIGRNFTADDQSTGAIRDGEPSIFVMGPWAVTGPGADVRQPPTVERLEAGAELGAVIGSYCRDVRPDAALDHVLGYTAVNDITARDFMSDRDLCRSKSLPSFCPLGPTIARDVDPNDARLFCFVNGELRQQGSTADLVWSVAEVVSFVSMYFPLEPGDVVSLGSPPPNPPIGRGDIIEVEIPRVGVLRNKVV